MLKTTAVEDTEEYVEESLSLTDAERDMIIRALDKHNGNRRRAAEELNISQRTLYRRIKEYGLEWIYLITKKIVFFRQNDIMPNFIFFTYASLKLKFYLGKKMTDF